MEFFVSRAMQIAQMSQEEIERLHLTENKRGYYIPNWNIQEMLGLPAIKDRFHIPENEQALQQHAERIRARIKELGLLNIEGDGLVCSTNTDKTHVFDNLIFKHRDRIDFDYQGSRGSKKLLQQVDEN